ncbi:10872_t:CDS:10 [Acaulospora morrowiae]|uniref:1-phosphatidylinositol 4-kinase n=1 Tax=Acaulospora morrowiae TaxID=94023 RepID=A0A9N9GBT1_9GLOM|nr:10872_t:CDS:10 [Acaulospora morrowiae]
MSQQLLLRLFQSEHFNSWMAISYLFKYPDSVGIQHYLCNELKKFPMSEIEFFLPQLCRTTESVALECFILESCEKSTHMAVLTLWYLQAYRSDLSANPFSPTFTVCKRVLNKCQAIVFGEVQNDDDKVGSSRGKVRENTFPALVGIGAMLAGIAAPMLTRSAGQIAIAQGRKNRTINNSMGRQLERRRTHTGTIRSSRQSEISNDDNSDENVEQPRIEDQDNSEIISSMLEGKGQEANENLVEAYDKQEIPEIKVETPSTGDKSYSISSKINGQSMPKFIKGHRKSSSRSSSSSLPSRHNGINNATFTSPSLDDLHKGNAFSLKHYITRKEKQRPQSAEYSPTGLGEYGPERQRRLLRGNYFHSEMQFLLALQDISTRLIIVPREARQSTLRAELTLLNHNLPAEICIPLWCPASAEEPYHHRVVRISPVDAVVLNSADRVPYLLMVEVLEGEISFDMSKLQTQKSMQRLLHEEKRKRQSVDTSVTVDSHKHEDINVEQPPEHTEETATSINIKDVEKSHTVDRINDFINDNENIGVKVVADEAVNLTNVDDKKKQPENIDEKSVTLTAPMTALPKSSFLSPRSSKRAASIDKLPIMPSFSLVSVDEMSTQLTQIDTDLKIADTSSQQSAKKKSTVPYTPTTPTLPESNSRYLKQVINRRQSNSADEFAERMRTAAVMLAQLNAAQQVRTSATGETIQRTKADTEAIRRKIISEMMGLEEERMMKMKTQGVLSGVGANGGEGGGGEMLEDEIRVLNAVNKDDPSAAVFSEEWETKEERIRKSSPFGSYSNWRLLSVIVKTGADLRQEQLACQLIREMQRIWQKANINVWVKYYRVLVTSDNSGLIETIQNSISIHSIKKDAYAKRLNEKGFMFTLFDYFVKTYGDVSSEAFLRAQDNFMRSLAAYSLVCYILQVKDRHNGNVLLDVEGHLIHIDFGFMLSNSPGSVGFELAPFKLSQEYLDILGGVTSEKFAEFKALLKQAFLALRKHVDNFVLLVEMMSKDSKLPCFLSGDVTASHLRDRFQPSLTEPQFEEFVEKLIMSSCCNVFTRLYDTFQYYSNGIL